jgi:predicted nucleic acid-binding protein
VRRFRPKFVLDTHLFIDGFRDPEAKAALLKFHSGFAPYEYLSVIVAQELRAGIRRADELPRLERLVLDVFERTGRTIAPSAEAWVKSGDVFAAMARQGGLDLARVSKSFANDVLLALSCRESGCILVTDNTRDFQRISRYVSFQFTKPWPGN